MKLQGRKKNPKQKQMGYDICVSLIGYSDDLSFGHTLDKPHHLAYRLDAECKKEPNVI